MIVSKLKKQIVVFFVTKFNKFVINRTSIVKLQKCSSKFVHKFLETLSVFHFNTYRQLKKNMVVYTAKFKPRLNCSGLNFDYLSLLRRFSFNCFSFSIFSCCLLVCNSPPLHTITKRHKLPTNTAATAYIFKVASKAIRQSTTVTPTNMYV